MGNSEEDGSAPASLNGHRFSVSLLDDPALRSLVELLIELQPGERLPSERELTQSLNVSRNTLRDRIGRLESMGVLTRKHRQGTFYTGVQAEQTSGVLILSLMLQQMTFDSLISVRHALERQAAIEACANATDAGVAALEESVATMQQTEDGRELLAADRLFHQSLFRASASSALIFFSQMLHSVLQGTLRHLTLERDFETMRRVHADILRAVRARDADAATKAIDAHFEWLHALRARELAGEAL